MSSVKYISINLEKIISMKWHCYKGIKLESIEYAREYKFQKKGMVLCWKVIGVLDFIRKCQVILGTERQKQKILQNTMNASILF